jgi:hypothetical protein
MIELELERPHFNLCSAVYVRVKRVSLMVLILALTTFVKSGRIGIAFHPTAESRGFPGDILIIIKAPSGAFIIEVIESAFEISQPQ